MILTKKNCSAKGSDAFENRIERHTEIQSEDLTSDI